MAGFFPFPPPANHAKLWPLYLAGSIAVYFGFLVVLVLGGAFSATMIYSDVEVYLQSRSSQHWPATTAQITSSWVRPDSGRFQPLASYTYEVEGISFEGARVAFSADPPRFQTKEEALILLEPFGELKAEQKLAILDTVLSKDGLAELKLRQTAERTVNIFFDPAAPENSTLRREFYKSDRLWINLLLIPLCCLIVIIWIFSVRTWIAYIKNKTYEKPTGSRLPN